MPPKGSPLYPKGSPKYNLSRAKTTGMKVVKKPSPKADKRRVSWNFGLEKALVELLHEHNNSYHRSQNGWSSETWNMMVQIFNSRHKCLAS
ncbi:hypothetical protein ACQ4PT_037061 [Festuca glaucescens]